MFDNDDRVTEIDESVKDFEQLAHIVEVEAGGRLVEQVKSAAGLPLAEFTGQLHALRLAP